MENDLTVRRSWPWKKKANDRINASPEFGFGGTTPTPPKLFDEQEVARILEDQSRVADEALHQAEEKGKAQDKKLETALSEMAAKDELVKRHMKVAEEAFIGWDKAEVQLAELKAQLEAARKQDLDLDDHVKYLEGALNECSTRQLQFVHKEQCTHETVVKERTTHEYDEICAEMNAQLAEASQLLAHTRNELLISQADANALTLALKEQTAEFGAMGEAKGCLEMEIRGLKVKLDGAEKDNVMLKQENQILRKDMEMWKVECEYQRKSLDSGFQQNVESVKTIAKLEAECARLRIAVNRKAPSGSAAVSRSKQDMNTKGKDRRNGLGRGHSRMEFKLLERTQEQDNSSVEENPSEADMLAKKIIAMEDEVLTMKEALVKRNEELQASRIMCAKTASQLSTVEEQLEFAMRAGTPSSGNGRDPDIWAVGHFVEHNESKIGESLKREDLYNTDSLDDFVEMERLAVLQSEPATSEGGVKSASLASLQHQMSEKSLADEDQDLQASETTSVADLQKTLADKALDLQAANESCQQLNLRLVSSAEQIAALQARNQANEALMIHLQEQLDGLLAAQEGLSGAQSPSAHKDVPSVCNSVSGVGFKASILQSELMGALSKLLQSIEVLAQATGSEHWHSALEQQDINASPFQVASGWIAPSFHWKDFRLESAFSNLVRATNDLLQGKTEIVNFVVELAIALDCVMLIGDFGSLKQQVEDSVSEQIASHEKLEIAQSEIANYDEELRAFQAEWAALESHLHSELSRVADIESQIDQLTTEKKVLLRSLSQSNEQVKDLKEQLHKTETLLEDFQRQEYLERKEEDMIEDELLELSCSNPGSCCRVTDADVTHLNEKVTALEVELHRECNQHQEVITKLEDLQEQIHQGASHSDHSGSSHGREIEWSLQSMSDDDNIKTAKKEREVAAAALAECQQTILALGKQLKVLGLQDSAGSGLMSTLSPTSGHTTTQTMDLLQWQTQQVINGNLPGKRIPWNSNPRPWTKSPPNSACTPQDHQKSGSCSPYRSFPCAATCVQSLHENSDEQEVSIPASPTQSDLSGLGHYRVTDHPQWP